MEREMCRLLFVVFFLLIVTLVFAEEEREIPLSEVPEKVLEVAQEVVPGIELIEAEIEETKEGVIYEVEGTLEGKWYEIEISADGKVLEVEREHRDDEEDGDGDTGEEINGED
jgi:hypothetical protein